MPLPPPQFSRLGTWCPDFVCVCVCVCLVVNPRRACARVAVVVLCVCLCVCVCVSVCSASVETSKQRYSLVPLRLFLDFDRWIFEKHLPFQSYG